MRRQYGAQIPGGDPGDCSDFRGFFSRIPFAATVFAATWPAQPNHERAAMQRGVFHRLPLDRQDQDEFQPADPEEAQVLAELNLPLAAMQAKVAEQAAKQSQAAAEVARDTAMREAERARRDAMRMGERWRVKEHGRPPVSIELLRGLDGLDRQDTGQDRCPGGAYSFAECENAGRRCEIQAVSMQLENSGKRHSPCRSRAEIQ